MVKLSRNDKTAAKELELLKRIKEHLEENKMAKSFTTDDEEEQEWLTSYNLLTYKPVIFAANVTEDDLANDGADNAGVQKVREYAAEENCEVFVVCAQIEQEIAELDEDEKSYSWMILVWRSPVWKTDQSKLSSARTDQLSDSGRAGVPCMDDHKGNKGTSGSRKDPYRFRTWIYPCGGGKL